MSAPDMAALLEALPVGKRVWIMTRGRSLWPLLRGGEQLHVERCRPEALERGDVAVLLTQERALVAHVVTGTAPLATASFNGRVDPSEWAPLGRVVALKAGSRELPLPRWFVRNAQRTWSAAARFAPAQTAWELVAGAWGSSSLRPLREWALGPVDVRLAASADWPEVVSALSMHEAFTDEALTQLLDGSTAALASARGAIVGVAVTDHRGRVVRLRVLRRAVGLGIEERLAQTVQRAAATAQP